MNYIKKTPFPKNINPEQFAKLKSMGNISEISLNSKVNHLPTIQPLSGENYVLLSTGEVKQFENHADNRTDNIRNLQKTFRELSDIINANVYPENVDNCRFITLTYAKNMNNPEQLYIDFSSFNKRFKRYINKMGYKYEYIVVLEAQQRGAFHLHCIYIFDKKAPFIENKALADLWGKGFVNIRSLNKNIDNIGRYLTSYLTDIPVDEKLELSPDVLGGDIKNLNGKRIVKGARLKMIPAGTRIYRCSRGIKKPEISFMPYGEAINLVKEQGFTKVNEYAAEISDIDREFTTQFIKETFKKHINKERTIKNE